MPRQLMLNLFMVLLKLRPSSLIVYTTSCLKSGVYHLLSTQFVIHYKILSNKRSAVQIGISLIYLAFLTNQETNPYNILINLKYVKLFI